MILSMTDDDGDVKLKMMICFGSDFAAQPVRVLVRCRSTLDFSSRSFKCRVKSRFGSRAELGSASDLVGFGFKTCSVSGQPCSSQVLGLNGLGQSCVTVSFGFGSVNNSVELVQLSLVQIHVRVRFAQHRFLLIQF
ncbi:hypothetical protein HanIR_Chr05g0219741 [Helianthus annuus]|nr:hypothetical protein HanIR_Chr05g0219741 [Helianthus annuus]